MITIEVNGQQIEAQEGEMLLGVLQREGLNIPTLCNLKNLTPTGACRMCVVEVEGARSLVASCAYPITQSIKVKTHSKRVLRARRTVLELMLATHVDDCLYCDRGGHCELQRLTTDLGVDPRRLVGRKKPVNVDRTSKSIIRDSSKCVNCGRCISVCHQVQNIGTLSFIGRGNSVMVGPAFNAPMGESSCINCGQCILVCPTGALTEQYHLKKVVAALEDPDTVVVVQHAPSVSVSIAEEFGMEPGNDFDGLMTAALRWIGFDKVFDTSFSADLTIMEEASELVQRVTQGGVLPMFTSCSPGWVKFIEQTFPQLLPNVSTCKSPMSMLGALIKGYFAPSQGLDPKKVFSVAVMPCTAKKFEAGRPEMGHNGLSDIDAVLTTRELARLFRRRGVNFDTLQPETPDSPFGERTTAGKLFGASGGVMEAALRTGYYFITGENIPSLEITALRGFDNHKELTVKIGDLELGVAVVNGLKAARELVQQVADGRKDLHFIEVMTCPGGCVCGGGQPLGADFEALKARMQALYNIDASETKRLCHENDEIIRLYKEFLKEPLGENSHHLLHTHYAERNLVL